MCHSARLNQKMALGALDQSFNDGGEVLRTPGLRKPPQIVGHSLGGRFAVHVAGGFPVGVIAVIFCGLASQPMRRAR
jgi:pimeloyl-ACP methyl ester carboxylesterase